MSTETTVKSALHRSSPSKSSIKEPEVDEVDDDDMWCNELQQNDLLLPEAEPKQQELSRKYSNLADIAIRLMIVLVFLWVARIFDYVDWIINLLISIQLDF